MTVASRRVCAKCNGDIVAGDKFCAVCGTRVARKCSSCGTLLLAVDRFCPDCGHPEPSDGENTSSEYTSVWDAVLRRLRSSLAGEYRITHELGRGGQAAVFLAEELALKRLVAIKVLAPGSFTGESAVERFRREAQTIANLIHANIVTIYSVKQVEELHFFVMQFVKGRSLADIILQRGQLPLTAIRAVAFQVGSALQYAHRRNVIHRDIKPANVLFDEDGNAILTDFGIAKDVSIHSSRTTGMPLGTPAYMSPEQCRQSPVSWASDQYALGILIYEMLTGRLPFEGSTFEIMQSHTDREPPPIRGARSDCPVELEWAVLRMLAKGQAQRWPTMDDALAALGASPLSRDDPIRDELRALAHERPAGTPVTPTGPSRLTMRIPEQLEVGESATCELFAVSGMSTQPQLVDAAWKVSDESIAGFEGSPEVLVGRSPGTVTLNAASASGAVQDDVQIVPATIHSVIIILPAATIEVGEEIRASAEARDRRGNPTEASFRWTSSAPEVATVARDGTIRAARTGSTRIRAETSGAVGERQLFVQGADAASIAVSVPPTKVLLGESFTLSAQVFDGRGQLLADRDVSWSSSDQNIALVDRSGTVNARGVGPVSVTARAGRAQGRASFQVKAVEYAAMDSRPEPDGPEAAPETQDELQGQAFQGAGNHQRRWINWRKAGLVAAPLVLVAAAGAIAMRSRPPERNEAAVNRSRDAVRMMIGPTVSLGIVSLGYELGDAVSEDFSAGFVESGATARNGRLRHEGQDFGYTRSTWNVVGNNYLAHFEVRNEGGDAREPAGLFFGSAILGDGRQTAYFLAVRAAPEPAWSLLFNDGSGYRTERAWTNSRLLLRDSNAFDLLVTGDTLRVFINDAPDAVLLLSNNRGSGFGVFADPEVRTSFDNIGFVELRK